jgi:tetratricopeptide (TPR) repeat protein
MNKKYKYLIVVLLILASLIAFGRILGNDFINLDDDKFITENSYIKAGINAASIKWAFTASYPPDFWHPLTWLSIMLDWNLFGANASGHHLVSLLWHIGSAILLFLFLSKTTGSLWPSAFVAALFALHPLRVESVAWAAERKDVLSMFFGMATIYAYAYYVEKRQLSKYFICLILFVLSLMSKPTLVTLPFLLLLLDYWPLGRWQKALNPVNMQVSNNTLLLKKKGKRRKADSIIEKKISTPIKSRGNLIGSLLWEKVPFIFLSVALTIMVVWQLTDAGILKPLQHLPLFKRVMNAIISYVSYLGKTFWPVDLAVFYPYQYALPLWQFLGALLILLLISIVVIVYIRKLPFLFIGWFWYLGTLVPVIGLVQGGDQAMADRYTYLPSIGIAIMLTWGVVYLLPKEKLRKIITIPAVLILAGLTFLTWQQCGYWKNSISLFNHVLQATKDNSLAHTNLGGALAAEGKNEEAVAHYLEAIKIDPNYVDTHYSLAISLEKLKKVDAAITHYREALRINPVYSSAHINLGVILEEQFKHDEALYHYRQALRTDPNDPGIYFNIGVALVSKGQLKEAIENFRQAVYLKPDYEDARRALLYSVELKKRQKR